MAIPFRQLKNFMNDPSYHEQMTKKEAEKKLREHGSSRCYLTRYSSTNMANKISVIHGKGKNKFEHFEVSKTKYALVNSDMEFNTASEMLEYYQNHPISKTLSNIGVPLVRPNASEEDLGPISTFTSSADGDDVMSTNSASDGSAPLIRSLTDDSIPSLSDESADVDPEQSLVAQAQPAHLTGITLYHCYQGSISGKEAKLRLEQQFGNSYLVRFSNSQNKHILSVLKRGDDNAVIFRNFIINTESKLDQHEYEIEGSQKKFNDFSELLNYYEKYPISTEINCIGSQLSTLNPPPSQRSHSRQNFPSISDTSYYPGAAGPNTPPNNTPRLMVDRQLSGLLLPPETNQPRSPSPSASSSNYPHDDDHLTNAPSLVKFISFPMADSNKVNLAEKIGVKCHDFGVLLLDDSSGDVISSIEREHRGNAYGINLEVFKMWRRGTGKKPVTWDTLVAVLNDIGLNKLANDIDQAIYKYIYDI